MITRLFLIPLLLCFIWAGYLHSRGFSMRQGKQGFVYILIFSSILLGVMTLMLWLTNLDQ